jgi:RNA polymerase sigma-54 factor
MEPAGIFARDITDSLRIQLQRKNIHDNHFEAILLNLNLIAKHDMNSLAKIAKLSAKNLVEYVAQIKSLNPRPLSLEAAGYAATRVSDVFVRIDEEGNLKVMLNGETMPQIGINRTYYTKIKKQKIDSAGKEFISGEYYNASNLVRSVNQRYRTILQVAKAIVEKQKNFFLKGIMYFEPLTLSDIASICNLNESTISRTTNGKYIQTESGIYEMKYFFSSYIAAKNSDSNVSSTKVKEIIKTIIETEEKDNIMSDDSIALELEKYNIKVARRTVAKYREAMGIETSSVRKRKSRAKELV